MINKLWYNILLLIGFAAFAQERQSLNGRVVAGEDGVANVFVINKTAGAEVKTDYKGFFTLEAKPGDRIIIYSTRTIVREFTLKPDSFKALPYVISVNYNGYELDELVINKYKNLNAESLGIVPKGQKRNTVAERRLYTAGTFTVGTVIALDPIINAISGRTRMLKRAYETEKQEFSINNMKGLYSDEDLTNTFNIPQELANGFWYYLAEDKEYAAALKSKNKSYIDFLTMERAKAYLKLQQDGK